MFEKYLYCVREKIKRESKANLKKKIKGLLSRKQYFVFDAMPSPKHNKTKTNKPQQQQQQKTSKILSWPVFILVLIYC